MSFLLKIENIAKSSKILISGDPVFLRSKDRSRTHDQKVDFENHNSPIRGLTTKTVPDLHGVTFLIPKFSAFRGSLYIYLQYSVLFCEV